MYCESFTAQIPADRPYTVTYCLDEENGRYGVDCFINGVSADRRFARALLPDITGSFEKGERLLTVLAKGEVCPMNAWEIIEEQLYK